MVREHWDRLSLTMKMIYGLSAWSFVFILVHGTYMYRVNHQRAFAKAVENRIGIASIRVRAKSDIMIYEGNATREQSEYAERIGQDFILRYGPSAVNPPTEIRNSLRIRESRGVRPVKQAHDTRPRARRIAARADYTTRQLK